MKTAFYQLRMLIADNLVYLAVMKIMPRGPGQARMAEYLARHLDITERELDMGWRRRCARWAKRKANRP